MKFWRRKPSDREIDDELQFHLDMRKQDHLDPDTARRSFGSLARIREETRAVHVSQFAESVAQDLRYAFRGLRRSPAFALTATAALALAIGATTAVFTVVDHFLVRSLPYRDAERLYWVGMSMSTGEMFLPASEFPAWR